MAETLSELDLLLADLNDERDQLDSQIEQMMAALAEVPPDDRAENGWGPDGALTREFLELTNRQTDLEAEIQTVQEAIAAQKPETPVH